MHRSPIQPCWPFMTSPQVCIPTTGCAGAGASAKCAGFKINDLMKEKTATSILFILPGPLALLTPLVLWITFSPDPLCSPNSYPAPSSAQSFYPALLMPPLSRDCRLPWCFLEISGCLGSSPRLPATLYLASVGCASTWAAISSSNPKFVSKIIQVQLRQISGEEFKEVESFWRFP